jgi:hypothetical protein
MIATIPPKLAAFEIREGGSPMKNSYLYRLTLLFALFSALAVFAQAPDPAGWWKFDDPADLLKPEAGFGLPLELVGTHQSVDGPAAGNGAVKIGIGSHYKMMHGIAPNGGGSFVNEFTLMFDFRVEQLNKWYTLFQTAMENNNDGDCFIDKEGNIGTGSTGYTDYAVIPNEWYRLVISVKNGTHYRYYLDGLLAFDADIQDIDGRYGLEPLLLLIADKGNIPVPKADQVICSGICGLLIIDVYAWHILAAIAAVQHDKGQAGAQKQIEGIIIRIADRDNAVHILRQQYAW